MPHGFSTADSEPAWEAWPQCPLCGTRRQCVCPICETAGTAFPLADYQVSPAPLRATLPGADATAPQPPADIQLPLLRCTICDEIFHPHFYHVCQACGHDFHDGIRPGIPARDDINSRAVAAVVVLLAVMATVFAYFWLLLR